MLSSAFCLPGLGHPAALSACRKGCYPGTDAQMICHRLQDVAESGAEHSHIPFSIKAQLWTGGRADAESWPISLLGA